MTSIPAEHQPRRGGREVPATNGAILGLHVEVHAMWPAEPEQVHLVRTPEAYVFIRDPRARDHGHEPARAAGLHERLHQFQPVRGRAGG